MSEDFPSGERFVAVDTLVLGNGPSGICMALALEGWWPFYRGRHPRLHSRLQPSLLEADWERLSDGLRGRSLNPVSLLFDHLLHPDPDNLSRRAPSHLFLKREGPALPYLMLGTGPPGGSWNRMSPDMLSLSPGRWMELPPSEALQLELPPHRLPAAQVAQSYRRVAEAHALQSVDARVLQLRRRPKGGFKALFCRAGEVEPEVAVARRVVLANGMFDLPMRLGVPGEDLPWVHHRAVPVSSGTVLVVGGGLSAADAITALLRAGVRVLHLFRDGRRMSGYAEESAYYPEYSRLHRLMGGQVSDPLYQALPGERLSAVLPGGECAVGNRREPVDAVFVLIGSRPDFTFLPREFQRQLAPSPVIPIQPFSFATQVPGVYALGPLVGDNFVRYGIGGAWAALRDLILAVPK